MLGGMASTPYPLPRETRETPILVGNGTAGPYGPTTFSIFDTADLEVWTQAGGGAKWRKQVVTVAKVNGNALAPATWTFAGAQPATTKIWARGKRTNERQTAVSKGGSVYVDQLEKELSKLTAVVEELRRDVDRAWRTDPGATGGAIVKLPADHFPLFDAEGDLVDGGTAADIRAAQANAATTTADREATQAARDITLAAAGSSVASVATHAAAAVATLPASLSYVTVAGRDAPGDGAAGVRKRRSTEPAHPAKIKRSDTDWLEWSDADGRGYLNTAIFAGGIGAQFNAAAQVLAALADDQAVGWMPDTLGIRIKPNTYVIDQMLNLAGSAAKTLPGIHVDGRGAQIKPNGLPTALRLQYTNRVTIEGLAFNWRGVNDASQVILVEGHCGWLNLNNLSFIHNSSNTDFAPLRVKQRLDNVAGERDTGNFWMRINRLWSRKLSGGDANKSPYVVDLQGCANDTYFRDCSFSGFSDAGVLIRNQNNSNGSGGSAPVNFNGCSFEDGGQNQVGIKWRSEGGIASPIGTGGGGATHCRFEGAMYPFATDVVATQVAVPFIVGPANIYVSSILAQFKPGSDLNHFALRDVSVTPGLPGDRSYWNGDAAYKRNLSATETVEYLVGKTLGQAGSLQVGNFDKSSTAFRLGIRAGSAGAEIDGGNQAAVRMAHLKGLSFGTSGVQRNNARLTATSPASGTSFAVTFATAEPDSNYDVVFPPGSAAKYWATAKTASGFTLNTDTAWTAATVIPFFLLGY